jgi:hypothetical protein
LVILFVSGSPGLSVYPWVILNIKYYDTSTSHAEAASDQRDRLAHSQITDQEIQICISMMVYELHQSQLVCAVHIDRSPLLCASTFCLLITINNWYYHEDQQGHYFLTQQYILCDWLLAIQSTARGRAFPLAGWPASYHCLSEIE